MPKPLATPWGIDLIGPMVKNYIFMYSGPTMKATHLSFPHFREAGFLGSKQAPIKCHLYDYNTNML